MVGGDSAGGNRTITLINGLRAAGEDLPACAWLVSPWIDLTMSGSTLATKDAADPLIDKNYLEELAEAYVPGTVDRKNPLISPLFADLPRLSADLIRSGSAETLLADACGLRRRRIGRRRCHAGDLARDPIHAWRLWNAALEDGRRALARAGDFIRARYTP